MTISMNLCVPNIKTARLFKGLSSGFKVLIAVGICIDCDSIFIAFCLFTEFVGVPVCAQARVSLSEEAHFS